MPVEERKPAPLKVKRHFEDMPLPGRGHPGDAGLDLTAMALAESPQLERFSGVVQDSGEGRWTVQAAVDAAVPADVLSASLYARFRSRQEHSFADKVLSAMRKGFGGHVEAPSK